MANFDEMARHDLGPSLRWITSSQAAETLDSRRAAIAARWWEGVDDPGFATGAQLDAIDALRQSGDLATSRIGSSAARRDQIDENMATAQPTAPTPSAASTSRLIQRGPAALVWMVWAGTTLTAAVWVTRYGRRFPYQDEWNLRDVLVGDRPCRGTGCGRSTANTASSFPGSRWSCPRGHPTATSGPRWFNLVLLSSTAASRHHHHAPSPGPHDRRRCVLSATDAQPRHRRIELRLSGAVRGDGGDCRRAVAGDDPTRHCCSSRCCGAVRCWMFVLLGAGANGPCCYRCAHGSRCPGSRSGERTGARNAARRRAGCHRGRYGPLLRRLPVRRSPLAVVAYGARHDHARGGLPGRRLGHRTSGRSRAIWPSV